MRDALHAILVPVAELFEKAAQLATVASRAAHLEQLEDSFNGEARLAFLWLQCFFSSEPELDWCYVRGCPACMVEHSLDSEFNARLLYTACLLSDVHYPFTIDGPTLPSFAFYMDSLRGAFSDDAVYGADFFDRLQPKAAATRNAIEDLIKQCVDLETLLLSCPATPGVGSADSSANSSPVLAPVGTDPTASKAKLKSRRGRDKVRGLPPPIEEDQRMDEMVKRCWLQLQPDLVDSVTDVSTRALDTVIKTMPRVKINEISPDD